MGRGREREKGEGKEHTTCTMYICVCTYTILLVGRTTGRKRNFLSRRLWDAGTV